MGKANFLNNKKSLWVLAILFVVGFLAFQFNWLGLQDKYYGSKYFRPYAELKQEQRRTQVVMLKDGRIFLPNWLQSEIFNPYLKKSELVPGWDTLDVSLEEPQLIVLSDGNVLIIQKGGFWHSGEIKCWRSQRGERISVSYEACPENKTPLFDIKTKKYRWVPFPLRYVQGATIKPLSNGELLFIGGGVTHDDKTIAYGDFLPGKPYFKNSIVIYNPNTYKYRILGSLKRPRHNPQIILTKDFSQALVFGGWPLTGEFMADSDSAMHDAGEHNIELVNLKTGISKIVASIPYPPNQQALLVEEDRYIFPILNTPSGTPSRIYSALVDISNPSKLSIEIFSGQQLKLGDDSGGKCALLPNKKIICVSAKSAIEIDPIAKSERFLDYMVTPRLSDALPILVPNLGLLILGHSKNILSQMKTVQRFDYERYVRDLESGER